MFHRIDITDLVTGGYVALEVDSYYLQIKTLDINYTVKEPKVKLIHLNRTEMQGRFKLKLVAFMIAVSGRNERNKRFCILDQYF